MLQDTQTRGLGAAMVLGGLAQFLVAFDASVTNVALRAIRDDVHFSPQGLSWVVNAYAIAFAGLMLIGGRLADRFGPRIVLRVGLVMFAVASLAAYACTQPWQVIAVRIVQGVGAAAIAPGALTAVAVTFRDPKPRAKAFAAVALGGTAGGAIGVVLSGVITDALGWRTVIACGAVIALLALALTFAAPGPTEGADRRTDWLGAALVTAGVSVLTYAIVATTDNGWGSARTLVLFAAAIALLAAFVLVELRTTVPLVDFRLIATRAVAVPSLVFALVVAGQFGAFYFVSLYLQIGRGYSATRTGVMFLPFCFGIVIAIALATWLMPRIGARTVSVLGAALAAAGFLLFSPLPIDGGFVGSILIPSLVTSIGIGMTFVPLPNIATAAVAPTAAGMVSGVITTSRQIGGALGLAVLVTIAATVNEADPTQVLPGYRTALLTSAALVGVGVLIALFLPGRRPEVPSDAEVVDAEEGAGPTAR